MSESLRVCGQTYTNVTGIKAKDTNGTIQTYIKPEGTLNINTNGTKDVTSYAAVNVNVASNVNLQANKKITPTEEEQNIVPGPILTTIASLSDIWKTNSDSNSNFVSFSVDLSSLVAGQTYYVLGNGSSTTYGSDMGDAWQVDSDFVYQPGASLPFSFLSDIGFNFDSIIINNSSIQANFSNNNRWGFGITELIFYKKENTNYDGFSSIKVEPIPYSYINGEDVDWRFINVHPLKTSQYIDRYWKEELAHFSGLFTGGRGNISFSVDLSFLEENTRYYLKGSGSAGYAGGSDEKWTIDGSHFFTYTSGVEFSYITSSILKNISITNSKITFNFNNYNDDGYHVLIEELVFYSYSSPTSEKGHVFLNAVEIEPIPDNYIDTNDANANASNILEGYTAYTDGQKITGTMPFNSYVEETIATQNGAYTLSEGYYPGGTITATLPTSTLTNSIINGASYEESTGDYAWKTTVNIPAGYHAAQTIEKNFSSIFPAPDTPATASQILIGYQTYDKDGKLVTGTMANNTYSNTLTTGRLSVTIPSGYHDGTGTVSVASGSVSVPNTTITANPTLSTTYTSGSGYQISVSKTQTVNPSVTAGYVSSGTGGTMTVSGSTYVPQSAITNNTTLPSGSTSSGTINFGSYIKIGAGYYPTDRYYRSYSTTGIVTAPSSISGTAATVSTGSNTLTLTKTVSVTPNVSTAGYISSGTAGNSSVSLTANITTKATATITPGTSNQTISAGTYLTGTQTISGDTDLVAANIKSGVSIFNTTGSFTSDATAGASEIISGATAYVDGEKVTGTLVVNRCYISSSAPSSSLGNNGDIFIQE